jgi:ribosomal protein S18 acetylase RimI-like enzyme
MMPRKITIRRATVRDLELLVPLFDAYRRFYRLQGDPELARRFLQERLERHESVIFLAFDDANAVGFTQLYPSFSSGAMALIFVLNDLFVTPEARRSGTGSALLRAAAEYGRGAGAARLTLSTELTNSTAQALYEREGWKRDTMFCTYALAL